MHVLNYLNKFTTATEALATLNKEYAIKASTNEDYPNLYVLNYNQIESPKTHDITKECRSLVIHYCEEGNKFLVVSRAFDRFFNLGETGADTTDVCRLTAYEKLDGSLITVFNYKGEWLYRTKSMIMPTSSIQGFDVTWKEVIEEGLGDYKTILKDEPKGLSFIFEITSPENRIVTKYEGRVAYLLSIRDKSTGGYVRFGFPLPWPTPKKYTFDSPEAIQAASKALPGLQEGYVCYNSLGAPVLKVKNPAYVAAHRIRGESILNPKRVMDLLIMNESDEYLSVFPEDAEKFKPYQHALEFIKLHVSRMVLETLEISDQKEYAMLVKDLPISGIMFSMKGGLTFSQAWDKMTTNMKYTLIEAYLEET